MRNNRGFTLIELIVVMVIAGIIAVGSIAGFNILNSESAKSTVERISSLLDYVQLQNMTKNRIYYLIIREDEGNYKIRVESTAPDGSGMKTEIGEEKLDLKKGGEITFIYSSDTNERLVSAVPVTGRLTKSEIEISFLKDTGSFKPGRGETYTYSQIGVSASGRSYTIHLVKITGKHYID